MVVEDDSRKRKETLGPPYRITPKKAAFCQAGHFWTGRLRVRSRIMGSLIACGPNETDSTPALNAYDQVEIEALRANVANGSAPYRADADWLVG